MKVLKGEIINNGMVMNTSAVPYDDKKGFFIALVAISESLEIDVPIWTSREDYFLQRNKEVVICLRENIFLRIYSE
ncbi:hypothetical protein [Inediibacterium massiliense]|uniref:hypothetical protein n=1 Tax=Inediibacterium massiliense TaxID=1658111 RepID=UPI0006B62687|nr:hypothetical protein [Inediibacterium massiliense]